VFKAIKKGGSLEIEYNDSSDPDDDDNHVKVLELKNTSNTNQGDLKNAMEKKFNSNMQGRWFPKLKFFGNGASRYDSDSDDDNNDHGAPGHFGGEGIRNTYDKPWTTYLELSKLPSYGQDDEEWSKHFKIMPTAFAVDEDLFKDESRLAGIYFNSITSNHLTE